MSQLYIRTTKATSLDRLGSPKFHKLAFSCDLECLVLKILDPKFCRHSREPSIKADFLPKSQIQVEVCA